MNYENLAQKYDELVGPVVYKAKPPTDESIEKIESHFNMVLPKGLIEFARASKNYGNWLASIGPDYEAPNHIIQVNEELRKTGELPNNFVAINVGYDEDYDCIDTQVFNAKNSEYLITYWSPGVPLSECELYENFYTYMGAQVDSWGKNA